MKKTKTKVYVYTPVQEEVMQFIERYNPDYFLTVQLPDNKKTSDRLLSDNRLRIIMKNFERQLQGRYWHKHHIPFIGTAENGLSKEIHYHILFNGNNRRKEEIEEALKTTTKEQKLPTYTLYLEPITCTPKDVFGYCVKELYSRVRYKCDSNKIITSNDLFNIPINT